MKKFLAVSLLLTVSTMAMACAWPAIHNYYVYSIYNRNLMSDRFEDITNQNWKAYTEGRVETYDADEVMAYAKSKNDTEMMAYLRLLNQYLGICGFQRDAWDYPSKEQVQQQAAKLRTIRQQALAKVRSKLRSQNALLVMRCNMQLDDYQGNIKFWNETGQNMRESVYRDMMEDLYAQALLKTGRKAEAFDTYARLGDMLSIKWCLEDEISLKGIQKLYAQAPNSAGLMFLVQRFVNDAQDVLDNSKWNGGVSSINADFMQEVKQFIVYAQKVASEGKTQSPVMWQSAAGWLEHLFGDTRTAQRIVSKTDGMEGTTRMKDNARVIRLLVNIDNAKNSDKTDSYVAQELQWLEEKAAEDRGDVDEYGNHYTEMLDRLVYYDMASVYDRWGRGEVGTALAGVLSENPVKYNAWYYRSPKLKDGNGYNGDYSNEFFARVDSLTAKDIEKYVEYISTPSPNPLQQWLAQRNYRNADYLNDLIGTKYLAQGELSKAVSYLEKVSLKFLNSQNICSYMNERSYTIEPWMEEQKGDLDDGPFAVTLTNNPKLQFAKDMIDLQNQFGAGNDKVRQQAAYKLAVMSYQASCKGDCWFLTHYGKSVYDSARVNEKDYLLAATQYLNVAKESRDIKLKEKALFGLAFTPLEPWSEEVWSDSQMEYITRVNRQGRQFKALKDLCEFYRRNPKSPFASKCDVLKQFEKDYN